MLLNTFADIRISHQGLQARQILDTDQEEIESCQALRYRYFAEARCWTQPNARRAEKDRYDLYALHLATFNGQDAVAYLRMLPHLAGIGFMLDHEFRCLLPEHQELKRHNAVELSRLVVSESLNESEKIQSLELLFKLFYRVALQSGYEHFYIVVEPGWLRICRKRFGFRFEPISPVHTFADGTRTIVGCASLFDLETSMREYSPAKFQWYASTGNEKLDGENPIEDKKLAEQKREFENKGIEIQESAARSLNR